METYPTALKKVYSYYLYKTNVDRVQDETYTADFIFYWLTHKKMTVETDNGKARSALQGTEVRQDVAVSNYLMAEGD